MTGALPILTLALTSLLALGLSVSNAAAQPPGCGSEFRPIEINNTTLHYLECGQGEPLVFVHGSLGDLHTFQPQVQAFAANFRVIAYSRRFSPPNAPPLATDVNPLSSHVADLRALITQLKAAPAHLAETSSGASIALALALAHPEFVRSLVLAEPYVVPLLSRTSVGEAIRQSWIRRVIEPSRKAFASGDLENGLRRLMDGICGTGCFDNQPQSRRTELVDKQGPELRAQFMAGPFAALSPDPDCGDLGKLKQPTLLVTGERSPAFFLLITVELERCLEGEFQVMVPEAGHGGMHRENAAFYNQAVIAFLQRR